SVGLPCSPGGGAFPWPRPGGGACTGRYRCVLRAAPGGSGVRKPPPSCTGRYRSALPAAARPDRAAPRACSRRPPRRGAPASPPPPQATAPAPSPTPAPAPPTTGAQAQTPTSLSLVPVNERPFGTDLIVLPVDHLLGDWYGLRTRLEDQGIIPTLSFESNLAG